MGGESQRQGRGREGRRDTSEEGRRRWEERAEQGARGREKKRGGGKSESGIKVGDREGERKEINLYKKVTNKIEETKLGNLLKSG